MQRSRRFSLRALAVILLAALTAAVPAQADEQPSQPLDPWAGLTYAVRARAAAEAHWYVAVHDAHERAAARARPRASSASSAPARLDGDRFDRLAGCESGGDATTNTGNGFGGAFQFVPPSWRAAWEGGGFGALYPLEDGTPSPPGSPWSWPYAVQKQVAMYWAGVSNPASQWPVCWPRSA